MRIGAYQQQKIPQVNLVPMMDVLMTVVTFFVILSMTLNGQQVSDIQLPQEVDVGANNKEQKYKVKPFILGINSKGKVVLKNKEVEYPELVKAIQSYFTKSPDGLILVVADKSLDYSKITQTLKGLRSIGGKQVSLAVEPYKEEGSNNSP